MQVLGILVRTNSDQVTKIGFSYAYVHANSESGTTEDAIVASFIPLELLAWLVVVENGRHISGNGFKKLDTAQRLEHLLQHSNIPLTIPKHFAVLKSTPLAGRERNGPRCLTTVRNALVHPRRHKRRLLARVDKLTLFELRELSLSYVEQAFLRALGYKGRYARRVYSGWDGDQFERVPWA